MSDSKDSNDTRWITRLTETNRLGIDSDPLVHSVLRRSFLTSRVPTHPPVIPLATVSHARFMSVPIPSGLLMSLSSEARYGRRVNRADTWDTRDEEPRARIRRRFSRLVSWCSKMRDTPLCLSVRSPLRRFPRSWRISFSSCLVSRVTREAGERPHWTFSPRLRRESRRRPTATWGEWKRKSLVTAGKNWTMMVIIWLSLHSLPVSCSPVPSGSRLRDGA